MAIARKKCSAEELYAACELNLLEFLLTDAELGMDMVHSYTLSENLRERERLAENVRIVLSTIAYFVDRISIPKVAAELRGLAHQLQIKLQEAEVAFIN